MTAETGVAELLVANPADGRVIGSVPDTQPVEVRRAAAELRLHQEEWQALGAAGRKPWLLEYRDWLLDNADEITDVLQSETGKVRPEAYLEVATVADMIGYWADHAARFLADEPVRPTGLMSLPKKLVKRYAPYPLVAVITPWNFPVALFLMDAMPALAAGCAVIEKPSEETPLAARLVARGWADIGAPPVLACLTGGPPTGAAVVDAADYVQFTGSTATGKKIASACAAELKPYCLELGGKDPAIVLADADLDRAVNGIAWGGMFNSGQICIGVERVYVEAPVHDAFVAKLVERVRTLTQGVGDGVDVGAMATSAQVDIVERHVSEAVKAGARVLTGGKRRAEGNFYEPTVLVDVDHSMALMTEETFGPALPVMKAADADEAVRLANDSTYGLSATVWTKDLKRAAELARRIEAGAVNVNDVYSNLFAIGLPGEGWKESGVGARLGGADSVRKYCRAQAITMPRFLTMRNEPVWYPYTRRRAAVAKRFLTFAFGRGLRQRLGLRGRG